MIVDFQRFLRTGRPRWEALDKQLQDLERLGSGTLSLDDAAEQQGNTFGVVTFGGQVGRYIPASGGGNHFGACRETIFNVESEKGNPDYAGLFTFLRNRLHKRALVLILTSLDDSVLSEQFLQGVIGMPEALGCRSPVERARSGTAFS